MAENPSSIHGWKNRFFFIPAEGGFPFSTVWLEPSSENLNRRPALSDEEAESFQMIKFNRPVKASELQKEGVLTEYGLSLGELH